MAINLGKGQRIDLTKGNAGLAKIIIGVGWDINKYDSGGDFDLDASAFLLDKNGKATRDEHFVFYNNLASPDGSVRHTGDNRTGEGEGDDEQMTVNLPQVPADVEKVAFAITIHDAETRNQTFGQVSNAFVRIVNEDNGEELVRYDLAEDFSVETAVVVGELYRHSAEWKFAAVGAGYQGGLGALVADFGLST